MAKPRSARVDYLVYLAVRWLFCVVQAMPVNLAWSCARFIGWIAYHVDRRHRAVALDNIRHAFPKLNDRQVDDLVRATYQHFALMAIETMLVPRKYHPSNVWNYFSPITSGDFDRAIH